MAGKKQTVEPPKSSPSMAVEQLGYVESFDAVVDKMYALVVYKETKTDSGKWRTVTFDLENVSFPRPVLSQPEHDLRISSDDRDFPVSLVELEFPR